LFRKIAISSNATDADALLSAIRFAHQLGAEVHVIEVISNITSDCYSSVELVRELETAKENHKKTRAEANSLAAEFGVRLYSHTTYGPLRRKLLETLDEIGADLLIVSEAARSNFLENLFADPVAQIVRSCPISVMVTKPVQRSILESSAAWVEQPGGPGGAGHMADE